MVRQGGEITGTYTEITGYEFPIYTSRHTGRSYIWYYQNYGPWINQKSGGGSTINKAGCAMTSSATIASGYGDMRVPQWGLGNSRFKKATSKSKGCSGNIANGKNLSSSQIKEIQDWLFSGHEVLIHVDSGSKYTNNQHWMPLVDISEDGLYVYNMNTRTDYSDDKIGWCSIESLSIDVDCYHLIDGLSGN